MTTSFWFTSFSDVTQFYQFTCTHINNNNSNRIERTNERYAPLIYNYFFSFAVASSHTQIHTQSVFAHRQFNTFVGFCMCQAHKCTRWSIVVNSSVNARKNVLLFCATANLFRYRQVSNLSIEKCQLKRWPIDSNDFLIISSLRNMQMYSVNVNLCKRKLASVDEREMDKYVDWSLACDAMCFRCWKNFDWFFVWSK